MGKVIMSGAARTEAAEQATPVIVVDSNGLITATAGSKSATKQLPVQTAKTVTPTTSEQVAVASGVFTTGEVKVAAVEESGGGIDTCTVVLNAGSLNPGSFKYVATRYVDGEMIIEQNLAGTTNWASFPLTLTDVVCGSAISLNFYNSAFTSLRVQSSTYGSMTAGASGANGYMAIAVTSTPDVTETIAVYGTD